MVKKMNEMQWLAYRLDVLDDIDVSVFMEYHWPGEWEKICFDRQVAFEQLTENMNPVEFTQALDESGCWDYDPTPDEEGEPPITWLERANQERPR